MLPIGTSLGGVNNMPYGACGGLRPEDQATLATRMEAHEVVGTRVAVNYLVEAVQNMVRRSMAARVDGKHRRCSNRSAPRGLDWWRMHRRRRRHPIRGSRRLWEQAALSSSPG